MTATAPNIELIEEIVGDPAIPCDYDDGEHKLLGASHGETRWQANMRCPSCGHSGIRLLCDGCQRTILGERFLSGVCPACNFVSVSFKDFVKLLKRL